MIIAAKPRAKRTPKPPPAPKLYERMKGHAAMTQASGQPFMLGEWLSTLPIAELRDIEAAAIKFRDKPFSGIASDADPLKVSILAGAAANTEEPPSGELDIQALFAQIIVLETLVRAELMQRDGLITIQGPLTTRKTAMPAFHLTDKGMAQACELPDLAAAHAYRRKSLYDERPKDLLHAPSSRDHVCPTCGRAGWAA
jgi:hypothetical protein